MNEYFLYDYCLLRTPVLPVESLLELNSMLYKLEDNNGAIKAVFSNPLFQEAIYIASKDLYAALKDWLNNGNASNRKTEKLLRSLHKYYSRMCTRSTPYGLFAGVTCATLDNEKTDVRFAAQRFRKQSRIDMGFTIELINELSAIPAVQLKLKYTVNNSLYKIGSKYIYVEYTILNGMRNYTLSALTVSQYIDEVIARAVSGATIEELIDSISLKSVARESLMGFIKGLIQAQVLVNEFQPAVTFSDRVPALYERLKTMTETAQIGADLETATNLLKSRAISLDVLEEATLITDKLLSGKSMESIQTDLFFNMQSRNINRSVVEDIVNTSHRLLSTIQPFTPSSIDDFKLRFSARYEDREVPLVHAMDPESGVGYGLAKNGNIENMPLLEGISIYPATTDKPRAKDEGWSKLVIRKMKEALESGSQVVYITDSEIDELIGGKRIPQHTSAYLFGSILANSEEALDQGTYKFFPIQLHAPHAAKLLTRFAYGDEELNNKLIQTTRDEQHVNPDTILAEILYFPEGHHANLVLRPVYREYEIPYLCSSSVDTDKQILISDLMVSVRDGRVVLRSARLNKEIVPFLSNAHNTRFGQPLYRFLSDLQLQQAKPGFNWRWMAFQEETYTPRVEYNNCILVRARWILKKVTLSDAAIGKHLNQLREELKIPRYVVIARGDNELFIDLDNPFCRSHLEHELRKIEVTLFEYLSTPDQCFIKDANGSYANEVIIPLGNRKSFFEKTSTFMQKQPALTRNFTPGTEWLYVKIYAGNKTQEAVLLDIIKPFAADMLEKKAIDQWFFLRYNDPEPHIRVRFHRSDNLPQWQLMLELLSQEILPFIENGQVVKMMVDTYVREIERYGEQTMLNSEALFFGDSIAISDFLDLISGEEGEYLRWQIGLYNVDRLLDDFEYSLHEKQLMLKRLSASFFKEFSNDKKAEASRLERSLNFKYRKHYAKISDILSRADELTDISDAIDCFKTRSIFNKAEIAKIKDVKVFNQLLPSYIHMTMNRLFLAKQRNHELVVYHYLNKYYESQIARKKQAAVQTEKQDI